MNEKIDKSQSMAYGTLPSDILAFMPQQEALDKAQVWKALNSAQTWDAFKGAIPALH